MNLAKSQGKETENQMNIDKKLETRSTGSSSLSLESETGGTDTGPVTVKNKTKKANCRPLSLKNINAGGTTTRSSCLMSKIRRTEVLPVSLKDETGSTGALPVSFKNETKAAETHPGSHKNETGVRQVVCLKRQLGLMETIAIIMGIVIGSGIFVSPSGVIWYTGSAGLALVVWPVSGIMAIIGALCFAELGTMFPESGGIFTYLLESFGPMPAFLVGWIIVVVRNSAGTAVGARTFSSYLVHAILTDCEDVPELPVTLIALVLIAFGSWLNCVNVKWTVKVQKVFTTSKVMALLVIVAAGTKHLAEGHTENYRHPFRDSNWTASAIFFALYQSLYAYNGWEAVGHVVEEMKNMNRNLPMAIVISLSFVTAIYTLTNAAYLALLTPEEMVASEVVALTFAIRTLKMMAWTMPVFIMCSTFGSFNGAILPRSRLVYVLARRGQFPQALSLLHVDKATPMPAIVFNCVLASLMVLTSGIRELINYVTLAMTLSSLGCVCGLLWLRYKQPYQHRPYKVWLVLPVVYALVQVFLLLLPVINDPVSGGISLALVFSGLPIYYLFICRRDLAEKCSGPMGKLTYFFQVLFLSVPGEKVD